MTVDDSVVPPAELPEAALRRRASCAQLARVVTGGLRGVESQMRTAREEGERRAIQRVRGVSETPFGRQLLRLDPWIRYRTGSTTLAAPMSLSFGTQPCRVHDSPYDQECQSGRCPDRDAATVGCVLERLEEPIEHPAEQVKKTPQQRFGERSVIALLAQNGRDRVVDGGPRPDRVLELLEHLD